MAIGRRGGRWTWVTYDEIRALSASRLRAYFITIPDATRPAPSAVSGQMKMADALLQECGECRLAARSGFDERVL